MTKEHKLPGIIQSASFGFGGYDGTTLGITFALGDGCWSVHDFWGSPSPNSCHIVSLETAMGVHGLLLETGKIRIEDLVGTPVEITLTGIGGRLKSWQVAKTLEEKFEEWRRYHTLKWENDPKLCINRLAKIAKEHYEGGEK